MIEVTGCRILVKPFKIQEQDAILKRAVQAGLALPEFSERKEQANVDKGTILQMGDSCHKDYIGNAKVGDIIGYAKFGGKFVSDHFSEDPEDLYLIINDEDLICIYKENKDE